MAGEHRAAKDVELSGKAGKRRKTGQRQHEKRHGQSEKWALEPQTGKGIVIFPSVVSLRQTAKYRESAHRHKAVGQNIKQQRQAAPFRADDDWNKQIAGVSNARIGKHT